MNFETPSMAREHVQPAVGMAQLAAESAAFVGRFVLRRTRDAVPLQPSVQRAAAEVGDVVSLRRPSMSSGGNIVSCRKATTMASSAGVSTVLFGTFAVVVCLRRLRTSGSGRGGGKGPAALLRRLEPGKTRRGRCREELFP